MQLEKLMEDMNAAMKNRDGEKLETLRYLIAEVKNVQIDSKEELDDTAVEKILRKEVKRRKDAIAQFVSAGREELAANETKKLAIIEAYLPEQMSEDEIRVLVDAVMAGGADDFGQVMGQVMAKTKGEADGGLVKQIVQEKLS